MHELAVCQALLEQVEDVARKHRAGRVVSITLSIGPLAGVEPALLESAYVIASAGTAAAGARLQLETPAVRVQCLECGQESDVESNRLVCRGCGHWRTRVLTGEELLLVRVELEREAGEYV